MPASGLDRQNAPSPLEPTFAATGALQERPSKAKLTQRLSSFGVLLLTLSCLSPIMSMSSSGADVLHEAGTGAGVLFSLGIVVALIWGVVYAELGSAYPYAGGDYVGVGSILGPWAGAATLAVWAAVTGPAIALAAKILADYVHELAPTLAISAVVFGGLAGCVVIALLNVRTSALVTGLFLAVEMAAVLALMGFGFAHPARGPITLHPLAVGAHGVWTPVSLASLALASVAASYATVGGNQAINFGEELISPHRRMGPVVITACLIGALCTALPVIAVVMGSADVGAVLRSPAPFATFIAQRAGVGAARALSLGVVLAVFNANIATIMGAARIFFSMGRDDLLPGSVNRVLAGVHAKTGVPRGATLVVAAYSAICCLLTTHVLVVIVTGLVVYTWSLVCLAVLIGRKKRLTGAAGYWRSPLYPLAPVAGLAVAAVFMIADLADPDAGRPSMTFLGLVVIAALLWNHFVLQRRPGGWTPHLEG
jgi:amino acid transporter